MLGIMKVRIEEGNYDGALTAAEKAAPYCHPKLSMTDLRVQTSADRSDTDIASEIAALRAKLVLSGFAVEAERMSGDKATRADAAASQANIGRLGMLRAPWNAALVEELAAFPRGVHDDQVDALSLAFSKLEQTDLSIWLRL
jgi:phage terminase large subunit-like protein